MQRAHVLLDLDVLFSEDPQVCHANDSLDLVAVGFLVPGCAFCLDYMLSVLLEVFLIFGSCK